METYAEAPKQNNKQKKKRRKVLPIILIVLGTLLMFIAGVMLFFFFKMKKMSVNAPPIVPSAVVLPDVTAEPADLVEVEDPGYVTIPDTDPDVPFTLDDIKIIETLPDPDEDPEDPDNQPIDPEIMEPGNDPIQYVPQINSDVFNILILGNDAKADAQDHGRSDVMMILSYNKSTRKAKLVSIVRDTYVYIPGREQWNRINTAYRYGGVGLAMNTINVNFGLDIQNYIRVDFTTMKQLVDAVGGIDLELSVKEIEYLNAKTNGPDLPLVAGVHHLNGAQVLRHARNRTVGNHVWTRAERHQQIMRAILERAKKEKNPVALMALMYQLVDKLDTNLGVEQMVSLAVDVVFGGSFQMSQAQLPFAGTWQYAMERGMAVIKIDVEANRDKLKAFLYGQ